MAALGEHDHKITRRYLLGQLTDDEQQQVEERLLSEDDFFQELELTKDELAQEYVGGQLTARERQWLQENFLASPEGKQKHEFAKTFDHYIRNHRPKKATFLERLRDLWNAQPKLLSAVATAAVLVIAVGLYSLIRTPAPRSVATLIVTASAGTRSTVGGSVPSVRLKEDVLKLTLMLPQSVSPGAPYRVELLSDDNVTRTFETRAQDTQSISVEIPAAQLPRDQYVALLSGIDANGNPQRMPGNYYFKVE